ncbi:MAG: CHAD domain-containing protein [Acetobacterium woodii]|nr:CHAD domain-containing protein [Acetobacterium woodii]
MEMMMEKLSRLLMENQGRYQKGVLLPEIPPIKSVKIVSDQPSLNLKSKKKVVASVDIILKNGFNEIINAFDYFFENPDDPEGVHQVRVRIRKYRAVLAFFMPIFEAEKYRIQQETLRNLGLLFGDVRQLDVLLEEITVIEGDSVLPICEFTEIKHYLVGKRETAFKNLMDNLQTNQFALDLLDILVWKLNQPWLEGSPDLNISIKTYTKNHIDIWLKKIKKSMRNLDVKQQHEVHKVRIKSKKLRYVIDQLSAILDKKTRKSMDQFEKIQDDLGYFHDVFANKQMLDQFISASENCQLYYQAGIIIGWQMMTGNQKIRKYLK